MTMLAICLTILGLIFIYAEFFYPGVLLGILGAFGIGGGVALYALSRAGPWFILAFLAISAFLLLGVCQLAVYQMKRRKAFFPQDHQEGYTAYFLDKDLIGEAGLSDTELRPSGYIRVGQMRLPALSEHGFIKKGVPIEIVGAKANYYIIKRGEA